MLELINGARSMVETCTEIKSGDSVLVIADNEGGPMWLGQIITAAVQSMGAKVISVIIPPRNLEQREPPAPVAAAMKAADAIFCISDRQDLVHTNARKEATAAGVKYYILHQFDIDDLKREFSVADIQLIKEQTESLAHRLTEANAAKVTTPSGTSVTMSLSGREAVPLHPLSQVVGTLPDYAEVAISPVEGTAEGTIVVDLSVIGWDYLFREPLRYTVKSGKVIDISGNAQEVDRLRKIYATDENASNIAELGIGTSHIIPGGMRGTRRDAARLGTAHIGIGRNNDIGGKTWSAIHLDSLMDQVTIELDGHCVLKEGVLQI